MNINKKNDFDSNHKSFIYSIHPSFKIILIILFTKIIFSLKLDSFYKIDFTNRGIVNFCFLLFYLFVFCFIFFYLILSLNYPFRTLMKEILRFKFIFFFSILLRCSYECPQGFEVFKHGLKIEFFKEPKIFLFSIIFLYFSYFFLFKNKNYKNFGFLFIFFYFWKIPWKITFLSGLYSRDDSFPLFFTYKDFFYICLIFSRVILFLLFNILIKETISFVEVNEGLNIIFKPLKRFRFFLEILTLVLSLIFMSISFLFEEAKKILKAQLSRGLNFYTKNIFKKFYYILSLLVPIFVLIFKKSFVLANSMEARGYVIGKERTKFILYKTQKKDYFLLFLVFIVFLLSFL
ncbi:energy-coupling factor transporter transmembrane component T [Candidatus Phytoplasma luffae]|uniref:energy-coupling factor transporter transmembrane component T n=1 Tax=Loofah witches'-broom phytoplasma TaxID=35773 RepID=UPI001B38D1DA|nr:energy-coupling factor transporter transmembrane component T [Candidatus Phytoplasma luffae]